MKLYQILLVLSLIAAFAGVGFGQTDSDLKLAKALEKSGRYEEALNLYSKLFKDGKQYYQVIEGIKECLTGLREYDQLIKFYQDLLAASPHQFNYRVELAKAYYLNGNEEAAFKNLKQVYTEAPNNPTAYRLTAMAYISFRLYDNAIDVYKKAIENINGQKILYRDIANLYRAQLDYTGAVKNLLFYYKNFKKQSGYVKSQLIAMSRDDEAVQKIIEAIQTFIKKEFSDEMIQEMLATMYVKNKQYAQAFDIYNSLPDSKENPNALLSYARLVENNRVYDYAVLAYEKLIDYFKSDSRVWQYKLDLAYNLYHLSLQQLGENKQQTAEDNVRRSISILDEIAGLNNMIYRIRSLELKGDIYYNYYRDLDQAIQIYNQILNENNHSEIVDHVKIKLSKAYLVKNNLQKAREVIKDIKSKKYKNIADFNLAELDYFGGQFSKAKGRYQKLISRMAANDSLVNNILDRNMLISEFSGDSIALSEFAQAELLSERMKKSEAAGEFLEISQKENKLSFKSGLKAGRLYMGLGKYTEAKDILHQLINKYPDEDGIDEAYFLLAEVCYLQKDYSDGLGYYRQILLNYPSSFFTEEARHKARLLSGMIEDKNDQ